MYIYNAEEIINGTGGNLLCLSRAKEKTQQCLYISTDGFAAILSSQPLNGGLPGEVSIFTAEMYTVKTEIENLLEMNQLIIQFSQVTKVYFWPSNQMLIVPIWNYYEAAIPCRDQRDLCQSVCWVSRHSGVAGNKYAHISVNNVATSVNRQATKRTISDTDMTGINAAFMRERQRYW